jgi:hypothetical protein
MQYVIITSLCLCGAVASIGYLRCALEAFGDRDQMAPLLTIIVLALGFIGLIIK